jgi:hypothetical protein
VQVELDAKAAALPLRCTQQPALLRRGITLRAMHQRMASTGAGLAPRQLIPPDEMAGSNCVQCATVQFRSLGPFAPAGLFGEPGVEQAGELEGEGLDLGERDGARDVPAVALGDAAENVLHHPGLVDMDSRGHRAIGSAGLEG